MFRIIVPTVLFFGAVSIGVFFLVPAWEKFQSVRSEVYALEAISAEIDELIMRRDELANKINNIPAEDLSRLEQIIPQGAESLDFLVLIDRMAGLNNIAVKRLDLGSTIKGKSKSASSAQPSKQLPSTETGSVQYAQASIIKELPINMQIAGSYEMFMQFLKELERYIRITDVKDISLTSSREGSVFDVSMRLVTYYQQ